MVRQSTAPHLVAKVAREHGAALAALARYGVWLFFILFNNLFFAQTSSVLDAIAAYGWGLALILFVMGVLCLLPSVRSRLTGRSAIVTSMACALGFCVAAAALRASLIDHMPAVVILVATASASIALNTLAACELLNLIPLEERFVALILCLGSSLALFCVVLFAPLPNMHLAAIGLALTTGLILAIMRWPATSLSDKSRVYCFTPRVRTGLLLLLAGCGFLCSYELNTMQRTTHFVQNTTGQAALGGTALASLLAVGLLILLLYLVLREIRHPRVMAAAIVFALVLFSIYYCLPIMENQTFPVSFILILATGCSLLMAASLLFLEGRRPDTPEGTAPLSLPAAFVVALFGALAGAVLAYLIMEDMNAGSPVGKILSFLPALIIFAIFGCFLFFWKDLTSLARPIDQTEQPTLQDLDTSHLEGRCELFSQRFHLTRRESEVLRLVSQGRNIPGIADALTVSQATAKTHLLHIYKKAGVSSRQELIDLLYGSGSAENG